MQFPGFGASNCMQFMIIFLTTMSSHFVNLFEKPYSEEGHLGKNFHAYLRSII